MTLLAPLFEQIAAAPDRCALIGADGGRITFAALGALSAARARGFRRAGIDAGARVLVALPLGIELYAALAGLWRIGAVPVFPEPALGLAGLRHAARLAQPRALLAGTALRLLARLLPELRAIPLRLAPGLGEPGAEVSPLDLPDEHPALISFTSGSTGAPKGIVRSHGLLLAQHAALMPLLRPQGAEEVALVGFPVLVLAHLGLGVTTLLPGWDLRRPASADPARILAAMARERVTRLLLPPALCERLAAQQGPLPASLRQVVTGGGPVFPELMRALAARLPPAGIIAVYGSTEAEPIAHLAADEIKAEDWQAMAAGAGLLAGRPVPEIALRIEADEILVSGAHVVRGYLDPAQDADTKVTIDGRLWHRTGDAGRLDETGRLWLLGRLAGRAGGLYPFCVEVAARGWPGVRRAALAAARDGRAVLAIEGETRHLDAWRQAAAALGAIEVKVLARIPLDARHGSKVDYGALARMI